MRLTNPSTLAGSAALSLLTLTSRATPARLGRLEHVVGADDVGLPRLGGVELEQREVLQRGGVEDDLRAVLLEHLEDALAIADVGEDERRGVEQGPTLELELGGVEARFVPVEHHQRAGLEGRAAGGTARSRSSRRRP